MAINSEVDICNLALGHLGNYGTVTNIETPINEKELTFALWYDISRQVALKMAIPNFALARKTLALLVETPAFGYANAYQYPSDCLKILGIDDLDLKANDYAIEGNRLYTDMDYPDGLPLRYIKDISDVTSFSPEFKMFLSWVLAANVALPITQDANKKALLEKLLPQKMAELSALNAQENRPIRISHSRFKLARYFDISSNPAKR